MSESLSPATKTVLTLGAAAVIKFSVAAFFRWQRQRKYEFVGRVHSLFYFPVKSCKAIEVSSAQCCHLGFSVNGVPDRHWMVVRPNGDFYTQRQEPRMALISVTCSGDKLFLDAPDMETLTLPLHPPIDRSKVIKCRIWNDHLEGMDCGQEAANWVSRFLCMKGLRVLRSGEGIKLRDCTLENKSWGNMAVKGDESAFSDYSGYMLMTQSSLEDLNNKLEKPVSIRNFRPNIVLRDTVAFDEDDWEEIKIGDAVTMRCLDACTRCTLTTVDPDAGVKNPEGEPLKTLKKYRNFPIFEGSPAFGINVTVDNTGTISVGDRVYAIRKTGKRSY